MKHLEYQFKIRSNWLHGRIGIGLCGRWKNALGIGTDDSYTTSWMWLIPLHSKNEKNGSKFHVHSKTQSTKNPNWNSCKMHCSHSPTPPHRLFDLSFLSIDLVFWNSHASYQSYSLLIMNNSHIPIKFEITQQIFYREQYIPHWALTIPTKILLHLFIICASS